MIKFDSKFSMVAEAAIERYQQGGLVNGDYVTFVKGYDKSDYFKGLPEMTQLKIKDMMETDLHLRISAIKSSAYAQAPVDGGMAAAGDFFADVVTEYAPGLYKDPITVPVNIIEIIDTADALGRMTSPDSQNYDNKEMRDPVKVKSSDPDRTLPTEDTKLPNANKWDDKAPGGGNYKKVNESTTQSAKSLGSLYEQVLNSKL